MATLTKKDLLEAIPYEIGQLSCSQCIHNEDCEEVNDGCVANYILNNEVVHLKEKVIC